MEIKIGNKNYELEFGLKFIRKMDEAYTIKADGAEFGMGIESAITYLNMKNPTVLYEIIKAGTSHLKSKPSNEDIENTLAKIAEEGQLDKTFNDIMKAMEDAPFLKQKIQRFKKLAKQ